MSLRANVPNITLRRYIEPKLPAYSGMTVRKVRRRGMPCDSMIWKVDVSDDYTSWHVTAYGPCYVLPGKRGCPECGETFRTNPIGQRQVFVECDCRSIAFWDLGEAKDFISVE